jgi:hypothetical protein
MEPEGSLLWTKELATSPCSEPDVSVHTLQPCFSKSR